MGVVRSAKSRCYRVGDFSVGFLGASGVGTSSDFGASSVGLVGAGNASAELY